MKRKIFSILFALVLVCSFSLVTAVPVAAANDWYVDAELGTDTENQGTGPEGAAFATIQYAIDDADVTDGDTINVAAGTYGEQVTIDVANLTLVSEEFVTEGSTTKNTTLINGGGEDKTAVKITADGVTLQGFSIYNYNYGVHVEDASATIDHCIIYNTDVGTAGSPRGIQVNLAQSSGAFVTITNNKIYDNFPLSPSSPSSGGRGINVLSDAPGDACGVLIDDNEIYGIDQWGIGVFYIPATITNNRIHDIGAAVPNRKYNVAINLMYNKGGVLIRGNDIEGVTPGGAWAWSAGIFLYAKKQLSYYGSITIDDNTINTGSIASGINLYFHTPTEETLDIFVTNNTIEGATGEMGGIYASTWLGHADQYVDSIEGNTITGNSKGIHLECCEVGSLHFNDIYDNTVGLFAQDVEVDATSNWWGSANGPGEDGNNDVSGNVAYSPWLGQSKDASHPWIFCVDDVGTEPDAGSIQAAIDAANPGDTVNVAAGTYNPTSTIVIDKDGLILQGPQAGEDPRPSYDSTRTAGSVTEAVIDGASTLKNIIRILADDVVIDGLEICSGTGDLIFSGDMTAARAQAEAERGYRVDYAREIYRPLVKHNIIHDSSGDEGVQLKGAVDGVYEYNHVFNTGGDGLNFAEDGYYLSPQDLKPTRDCVIQHNEIHDIGYAKCHGGIFVYNDGSGDLDVEIRGNLIYDINSAGIKLGDYDSSARGGEIIDNIIRDTAGAGVRVRASHTTIEGNEIGGLTISSQTGGITVESGVQADTVLIHFNSIHGNTFGVKNEGTGTVDAKFNWWGNVTGPDTSPKTTELHNPYEYWAKDKSVNAVSNNVDYIPWLIRIDLVVDFAGWNIVSFPIMGPEGEESEPPSEIKAIYYFDSDNQRWGPDPYQAGPLDAMYVKVSDPITFTYPISSEPSELAPTFFPSQKEMKVGWNFVGLAELHPMPVKRALASAFFGTGQANLWGYSQVVSPSLNGAAWTYIREQQGIPHMVPIMVPTKGYWVLMVNDGVLGGFSSTPIIEVAEPIPGPQVD